jgi:polyhydroxyalkanoate synthesis repressor PhaR
MTMDGAGMDDFSLKMSLRTCASIMFDKTRALQLSSSLKTRYDDKNGLGASSGLPDRVAGCGRNARLNRMAGKGTKEPTIIKKYANRRLYHTGTSSYVTLEDLSLMVREGEDFVVTDAKTGEDLTRSVLTQIIFEQENKGQFLLPVAFLRQLIQFYGDNMQALVPRYLEFSLERFMQDNQKLRDQMSKSFGVNAFNPASFGQNPMAMMEEQVRTNMTMFQDAMRAFSPFGMQGQGNAHKAEMKEADKPSPPAGKGKA